MNRLWVRITIAMLLVTWVSVLTVSVLAHANAATQFSSFVERQRSIAQSGLLEALAEHYAANQSWNGIDGVFEAAVPTFPRAAGRPPRDGRAGRPGARFALADANAIVVRGDAGVLMGAQLDAAQRAASLPITLDAKVIGYLLVRSSEQTLLSEAQNIFLAELQRNIVYSVLVSGVIAVALGILVSRVVAAPLADLAKVARRLSERRLDVRAEPRGAQEIADVAIAFNGMAASLQQAETNRRNLTADIAHELRTPLTVIQGNLRAMIDGVYPLDRAEISTVYDETRLLGRLVEDLRVLALAEARQLDLRPQHVDVEQVLRATAAQFQVSAENANVRLSADSAANLPPIHADADRVAQVLRNLVNNALRHTPAGGTVTLTAEKLANTIRVAVRDTGEGIATEKLPNVFERFFRGDASRARETGGSGLGLAIVKSLVEAMGGQVGVESALGKGSSFWFTLPSANAVHESSK